MSSNSQSQQQPKVLPIKKEQKTSNSIKRTRSSTVLFVPRKPVNVSESGTNDFGEMYERIVDVICSYKCEYDRLVEKNEQLRSMNKKLKRKKRSGKS